MSVRQCVKFAFRFFKKNNKNKKIPICLLVIKPFAVEFLFYFIFLIMLCSETSDVHFDTSKE